MIYVLWGAVALSLLLSISNALDISQLEDQEQKKMEAITALSNIVTEMNTAIEGIKAKMSGSHTEDEIKAAVQPVADAMQAALAELQAL